MNKRQKNPAYPIAFLVTAELYINVFNASDKHPPTTGTKLPIAYFAVFIARLSPDTDDNPVKVRMPAKTVITKPIMYLVVLEIKDTNPDILKSEVAHSTTDKIPQLSKSGYMMFFIMFVIKDDITIKIHCIEDAVFTYPQEISVVTYTGTAKLI